MRIGILTSGGDAPGLNAVIRAVVLKAESYGHQVIGLRYGWKGLMESDIVDLTRDAVDEIHSIGGTMIGSSRTNPTTSPEHMQKCIDSFYANKLDALIAIGGDDTQTVANELYKRNLPIVGVPKTIDNDLSSTDYTFGFDTAVNIATECLDRLRTTAKSHNRVMIVEMMGREAGWITLKAGIAGGAHFILIPEIPFDIEEICDTIRKRKEKGKNFSLIAVAEGAKPNNSHEFIKSDEKDAFGHENLGGIANFLAKQIKEKTGADTRSVVLGHLQRGGPPSAFDRVLATIFGVRAVDLVQSREFGKMVALQGTDIIAVPFANVLAQLKRVQWDDYNLARSFFG